MKIKVLLFLLLSGIAMDADALSLLKPVAFPTTKADATFVERVDVKRDGYTPYAGKSGYTTLDIESEEEYINRILTQAEYQRQNDLSTMSPEEYCDAYPLDAERCPQTLGLEESVLAIGNRPTAPAVTVLPMPPTVTPTTESPYPATVTPPVSIPSGNIVGYSLSGQPVVAGNHIHNGPCTPPQRSKHFRNDILTSGRYETRDPAFEKTMITIFRKEGNCGYHPNDSGGYTCYGIASNANPDIDLRNLTRADAEDIAYDRYYKKYGIDKLPDVARVAVLLWGWGSGPATGIKRFCRVLGIPERTHIDDQIVKAAENYQGDLYNDVMDAKQKFLHSIAKGKNKVFLKGWMNALKLQRENGCHTPTTDPLSR